MQKALQQWVYIYIYIYLGNGLVDLSPILDEADFSSNNANTIGKGMNPTILSSATGKLKGWLSYLTLV